jgi:hypothetical protein
MAGLTLRSQIGRKLSISEMDGNLTYLESISSGGLPQTALVNNYPAHPSLNNSHIGRCIMFDFNSQQAMLTQSSGATAGNKWSATVTYSEGFIAPTPSVWVVDIIAALNDGDQIGINNMNGLTNYFYARTSPAYSNDFQIGATDADTALNFFACLQGFGSGSFCYPENVSGSQITLVMAVCENHIGSQGNDSNIITTNTANISTAITKPGVDNIMGNWKDNIFSWYNSSGLRLTCLYFVPRSMIGLRVAARSVRPLTCVSIFSLACSSTGRSPLSTSGKHFSAAAASSISRCMAARDFGVNVVMSFAACFSGAFWRR